MKMNKKLKVLLSFTALSVLPVSALADGPPVPAVGGITNVWILINNILNLIWPIFIGISVIMFIVAGIIFLTASGDPNRIKLARDAVIWGVVGVIIGIVAFSLPYIIQKTIVPDGGAPAAPAGGAGAPAPAEAPGAPGAPVAPAVP